MSWTVIVEKQSGRLVYARRDALVVGLQAIFPSTAYNYVWLPEVREEVRKDPWNFSFNAQGQLREQKMEAQQRAAYSMQAQRADLLSELARAVAKHRRFSSPDILGQDAVYEAKVKEAQACRQGLLAPDMAVWLLQGARLHGHTVMNEADLILLRHQQATRLLVESEERRLIFQKRILEAQPAEFDQIHQEIKSYERTV